MEPLGLVPVTDVSNSGEDGWPGEDDGEGEGEDAAAGAEAGETAAGAGEELVGFGLTIARGENHS
jgi:hypothetical protein